MRRRQRARCSLASLVSTLRRLAAKRLPLGALCTGGYALAHAGLLDGYRATIHWENLSALREQFPRVLISDHLFSVDRNRYTCSGGVAPLELMLNLIEEKLGSQTSQRVSEQFIVERKRDGSDRQYVPLRAQVACGAPQRDRRCLAHGSKHRESDPAGDHRASIGLVAPTDRAFIQAAGQLRAETLLPRTTVESRPRTAVQTSMPIMAISTACGFQSPPHFSKCYRNHSAIPLRPSAWTGGPRGPVTRRVAAAPCQSPTAPAASGGHFGITVHRASRPGECRVLTMACRQDTTGCGAPGRTMRPPPACRPGVACAQ